MTLSFVRNTLSVCTNTSASAQHSLLTFFLPGSHSRPSSQLKLGSKSPGFGAAHVWNCMLSFGFDEVEEVVACSRLLWIWSSVWYHYCGILGEIYLHRRLFQDHFTFQNLYTIVLRRDWKNEALSSYYVMSLWSVETFLHSRHLLQQMRSSSLVSEQAHRWQLSLDLHTLASCSLTFADCSSGSALVVWTGRSLSKVSTTCCVVDILKMTLWVSGYLLARDTRLLKYTWKISTTTRAIQRLNRPHHDECWVMTRRQLSWRELERRARTACWRKEFALVLSKGESAVSTRASLNTIAK